MLLFLFILAILNIRVVYAGLGTCAGCCAIVCAPTLWGYPLCVVTCVATLGTVCPAPGLCIVPCIAPLP